MRGPVRGGIFGIVLAILALCAWRSPALERATVFSFSSSIKAPPPDSDADGLPDLWETQNGLDPASAADARLDLDGDGLSALDEYGAISDPWSADSDQDGIADGASPSTEPPGNWTPDHQNLSGLQLYQPPD